MSYDIGDLGIARKIAQQRAGRQCPGESDIDYARVAEGMPRANPILAALTSDAIAARNERKQRRLKVTP